MRCQNINRKHSVGGPECKKKLNWILQNAYMQLWMLNMRMTSAKSNKELLKKELTRPKQKPDALKELIKRTFKTKT